MRYSADLPLALRGVSFSIAPGETMGLVGRTGSGKTSIILAMTRVAEIASGSIEIDGLNVRDVSLYELRSRVGVVMQEPLIFYGSMLFNVDPLAGHAREEVVKVLMAVGLYETTEEALGELEVAKLIAGGEDIPVGVRQLICLARMLLRGCSIALIDEATSSLDSNKEAKLQEKLATITSDMTCLVNAHRIQTVLGADQVMVLEAGQVVEVDSPAALAADPSSHFSKLLAA